MIRTFVHLIFGLGLLVASTLYAGGGGEGGEGPHLPSIDLDMLVFDDQTHFVAVMTDLIAQQEALDALPGDDDDPYVSVFKDYADALGFESLEIYIESETARLRAAGVFDDENDPDNHHIFDPYLRGVLNPQSEVMIGQTIYRHQPQGTYEIANRDVATLERIRQGEEVPVGGTVSFDPRGGGGDCCRGDWTHEEHHDLPGPGQRMKVRKWVHTNGAYSSVGAFTLSQKAGSFGWRRKKVDLIGVRGSVLVTDKNCMIEHHEDFNVVRSNKNKAEAFIRSPGDIIGAHVKDYFDTTHWLEDGDDAYSTTLSLCGCRDAVANFDLPLTAHDRSFVPLDGHASDHEDRFFLEIYPTDAIGSDKVTGTYWSSWFHGGVGNVNLADHYNFSSASVTV
ncbi:MAG: hypothetical protein AAGD38_08505 [Acidobacteriota bacterium]